MITRALFDDVYRSRWVTLLPLTVPTNEPERTLLLPERYERNARLLLGDLVVPVNVERVLG